MLTVVVYANNVYFVAYQLYFSEAVYKKVPGALLVWRASIPTILLKFLSSRAQWPFSCLIQYLCLWLNLSSTISSFGFLTTHFLCNIVNQLYLNFLKILKEKPEHFLEFPPISLAPLFQSPLLVLSLSQISLVRGPLTVVFGLFLLSICTFLQGFCI